MAHIKNIYQTQKASEDEEANVTELYDIITVKAKNLAVGPWYKCSKGRHLS